MINERLPDHPGQPLTETHYALLLSHCQAALTPFFPTILPALHLKDTSTHPFLELYVASPEMELGITWRGEDRGKITPSESGDEVKDDVKPMVRAELGEKPSKSAWKDSKEGKALAKWLTGVVGALGGVEWYRTGGSRLVVTIAVPVEKVLEKADTEALKRKTGLKLPCFQVDLYLTSLTGTDFARFVMSYKIVHFLLKPLIKFAYPRLWLAESGLEFHYTPFTGYPTKVYLPLTRSPRAFCEWFGLDYDIWKEGFETKEDVWDWVLAAEAGSVLGGVLRRVKGGEQRQSGRPGRRVNQEEEAAWEGFVAWLQDGSYDWEDVEDVEDGEGGKQGEVKMLVNARSVQGKRVDLSKPRELDGIAMGIIRGFDKEKELDEKVKEVKMEAAGVLGLDKLSL